MLVGQQFTVNILKLSKLLSKYIQLGFIRL